MQSNCYLIENNRNALLIDPGDCADFLIDKIQSHKLKLNGIIATHGHFDHIMAVGEIQISFPHVPFLIHDEDRFLIQRAISTACHFLEYKPAILPIKLAKSLEPGNFRISNFEFKVIHTPGHTPGSCCINFEKEKRLFSGDTLFKSGVGRVDFSYSSPDDLKNSIKNLLQLPKITNIYPGHGESTSIENESCVISDFF